MSKKEFLRANWLRLASINYEIDASVLKKHLPYGTELESHNGKHYVSLVGFKYTDTRLLKIKVPWYKSFEEINLRFYVKREIAPGIWRSEVAFTKLYFPKKMLTFVANRVYKENYETRKMMHQLKENEIYLFTSYGLKINKWHYFEIQSKKELIPYNEKSDLAFFSKQLWGTSQIQSKLASTSYEIEHPLWNFLEVTDYHIDFDFGLVFGSEFSELNHRKPSSILVTEGSKVIVYKRKIIS